MNCKCKFVIHIMKLIRRYLYNNCYIEESLKYHNLLVCRLYLVFTFLYNIDI